jgi:23S rRNA pseudouridine1911/1915/1917 synthase
MADSEPPIIYEDEAILVIDKPAGLVVNRSETSKNTLQDWAEKRSGMLVHRLDKETSGVMVIAKTPAALAVLQRQFKDRRVVKTYVALVYGKLVPAEGIIAVPIGRSRRNRAKFAVVPGGRPAETAYRVMRYKGSYTLLQLRPKTGRTHQLRVHLSYFGHPVVGDKRYAGSKQRQGWSRHLLHAAGLSLIHPVTGKRMEWQAALPAEFKL